MKEEIFSIRDLFSLILIVHSYSSFLEIFRENFLPEKGLEPSSLTEYAPQAYVYTNSTTPAQKGPTFMSPVVYIYFFLRFNIIFS